MGFRQKIPRCFPHRGGYCRLRRGRGVGVASSDKTLNKPPRHPRLVPDQLPAWDRARQLEALHLGPLLGSLPLVAEIRIEWLDGDVSGSGKSPVVTGGLLSNSAPITNLRNRQIKNKLRQSRINKSPCLRTFAPCKIASKSIVSGSLSSLCASASHAAPATSPLVLTRNQAVRRWKSAR